jgi:hypothetical protein
MGFKQDEGRVLYVQHLATNLDLAMFHVDGKQRSALMVFGQQTAQLKE